MNASTVRNNQSYASIAGDITNMGGVIGKLDAASYTITGNRYSSAEHGIGNNAQGVPSEEGCTKVGASIAITTSSLPNATANSAYTAALTTDSTSSVVWTLTNSTSLPEGLTLDRTTGTISGTPKTAGTYTFTVKASPAPGAPATKEFTLTVQEEGSVTPPPTPTTSISITTTSLPSGTAGQSYSATLSSNPSGATWAVASGSLPNGLTLNSNGRISGTPTSAGTATFSVRATYGSASTTQNLSITINAPSLSITTNSLPSGWVGSSYRETLSASSSSVTWAVYSGSLPNGLTLVESSGIISGTPTSAGMFYFTIQARSAYTSTQKSFSIVIYEDSGSSSGGGGCSSGIGIMGLILLAGIAFRKSHR